MAGVNSDSDVLASWRLGQIAHRTWTVAVHLLLFGGVAVLFLVRRSLGAHEFLLVPAAVCLGIVWVAYARVATRLELTSTEVRWWTGMRRGQIPVVRLRGVRFVGWGVAFAVINAADTASVIAPASVGLRSFADALAAQAAAIEASGEDAAQGTAPRFRKTERHEAGSGVADAEDEDTGARGGAPPGALDMAQRVKDARFRTTHRVGYDMRKVDEFLQTIEVALRRGARPDVAGMRADHQFPITKWPRPGYVRHDVRDLLDEVVRYAAGTSTPHVQ